MLEGNTVNQRQWYHNNLMIIKLQGSMHANPTSLFLLKWINRNLSASLGHHDDTLFIPKQQAHKETDSLGAVSSLPIDIII